MQTILQVKKLVPNRKVPIFQTHCRKVAHGGEFIVHNQLSGWDIVKNPALNKGLAFPIAERQRLGIQGIIPTGTRTQCQQARIHMKFIRRVGKLFRHMYLMDIKDRNEKLFFRMLRDYTEELMPIVYTPTVGLACQTYGLMYRIGRGLFISKYDRGHIKNVISNWPESRTRAVVMTDGERILGLGDLGAFGMGIPVGKLALYTALGGVKPNYLLPITVDVGTNNEKYLHDPIYIGIREKRITGPEYESLIDEIMEAIVARFGCNCLIQFEDFSNVNAFYFLNKYRYEYCVFNDDIQGTASAVVAGLLVAEKISGMPLEQHKCILFYGAGGANLGIAELMIKKMEIGGVPEEEARKRIWMIDIDGLLTEDRNLDEHRKPYAKKHAPSKDLTAIVKEIKPSILIGASTVSRAFTPEILKTMGDNNKRPIIFSLSNPTDKSECTAQEAYDHTEGRAIFASGSPFPAVQYKGKTYHTGQANNAYIFPGIALGVIALGIHFVMPELFLIAAQTVADQVTEAQMQEGRTFPPLSTLQSTSFEIAVRIAEYSYCRGLATVFPQPKDLRKFIRSEIYNTDYTDLSIVPWPWPKVDDSLIDALDTKYIETVGTPQTKK